MLSVPESELESRHRLIEKANAGRIPFEQAYRTLLESDPFDEPVLLAMAALLLERGDLEAAEKYAWQAVEALPVLWQPWLELAQLIATRGDAPLAIALTEIAARRLKMDTASLDELEDLPDVLAGYETGGSDLLPDDSSSASKVDALIAIFASQRAEEPPEVTSRLRLHRLLLELEEADETDRDLVDRVVREGEAIVPLLIASLRGYARTDLCEPETIESVLALLGEIGSPLPLEALIEFSGLDDPDLSGAAGWAFDRIVELQPEAAGQALIALTPKLDGAMRLLLAERFIFWPRWNVVDRVFDLMTENIDMIPREERGTFFATLAMAMIVARRREGLLLARRMLRRNASLMDRGSRRECEEKIELFSENGGNLLRTLEEAKRAEWTVYQICAGEAEWPDDDEAEEEVDEDEGDELFDDELAEEAPVPVQRPPAPGRNEPCWCGSGKKYKKCHLDADNPR
jgi:hypothetical protein